MQGLWLASYVALWVLALGLGFLVLGLMKQFGDLRTREPSYEAERRPRSRHGREDGPELGARCPKLVLETANGYGSIPTLIDGVRTMVVFMSPLCEGCQTAVEALNGLDASHGQDLRLVTILQGIEPAARAFMNVFRLDMPTVLDPERTLSVEFETNGAPFALLCDLDGRLVAKGSIPDGDAIREVLGDRPLSPEREHMIAVAG